MTTFKDKNRSFQELCRELKLLNTYNKRIADKGETHEMLFLMAEGALVLVALERFMRILLPKEYPKKTLANLIDMTTGKKQKLLKLPGKHKQTRKDLLSIRNTLLHGNYEQAAREAGFNTVGEYFAKVYAAEIENAYVLLDNLVAQVDPDTGKPWKG